MTPAHRDARIAALAARWAEARRAGDTDLMGAIAREQEGLINAGPDELAAIFAKEAAE